MEYTLNDIRKKMLDIYKENSNKRLNIKDLNKYITNSEMANALWRHMEEYYGLENYNDIVERENKQKLIEEARQITKELGRPLSSKYNSGLTKRVSRYWNTWVEFIIDAGLEPNRINIDKLSQEKKDDIIESLLFITIKEKQVPFKSLIHKNNKQMPTYEQIEKMCGMNWDDLIYRLGLKLENQNQVNAENDKFIFDGIKSELKRLDTKSLIKYSLEKLNEYTEFVYIMNKHKINWNWFLVLSSNNFVSCNSDTFKCNKEDIIDILSFKYLMYGRQLKNIEIDQDKYMPNTTKLITMFDCGIYELWFKVEQQVKTKML